jgi:hypothetical protein
MLRLDGVRQQKVDRRWAVYSKGHFVEVERIGGRVDDAQPAPSTGSSTNGKGRESGSIAPGPIPGNNRGGRTEMRGPHGRYNLLSSDHAVTDFQQELRETNSRSDATHPGHFQRNTGRLGENTRPRPGGEGNEQHERKITGVELWTWHATGLPGWRVARLWR